MKKVLIGLAAAVFLLTAGIFIYIGNYYHAGEAAMALIESPEQDVHLMVDEEGRMAFVPEQEADTGIIFYPGGKVQAESYAPLLEALAEEGILSVLVPMPAKLAVLDVDGADGIVESYGYVDEWYMAGHSLGGSMAASYLANQSEGSHFAGLILLAAYSTADLSESPYEALTIYGDQDGVLDMKKYEDNYDNLPEAMTEELIIKGGNHAQFGDYGEQKGDGEAKISAEEQITATVDAVVEFLE
ncbi:MAG: alpha/beta hydrolase [Anaerotignum sp.]|nr:alpha/beta hydrolase [Anaerotignum sp.]MBR3756111.1 alpha/beta hydrolase [Bacillota bacterium]